MEERFILGRKQIRTLVEKSNDVLRAALSRGENIHQLTLDIDDEFFHRISHLSSEEQDRLRSIYLEEVQALNAHLDDLNRRSQAELNIAKLDEEVAKAEINLRIAQDEYQESKEKLEIAKSAEIVGAVFFLIIVVILGMSLL